MLKNLIQNFIKENKIKTQYVSLVLRIREIVIKVTSFTNLRPREVEPMLKHDLKSYIPVDISEYTIDYKITRGNGNTIHVLIAAIPEKIIESYISLFKELSITPISIDIYQNCVARAFPTERNTLVISDNAEKLQLSFLDCGVLNGTKDILFTSEEDITNEVSKLFDSFLTSRVFESAHILSERLEFLKQYFELLGIRYTIQDADFYTLERGMFS